MARKHERTLARRMAVQALYQSEITGTDIAQMEGSKTIIPDGGVLPEYALRLLAAISEHAQEIDDRISNASENWSLFRMPIVDRAILRVSVCEIFFIEDVPVSVSINEAVELAKEFGGEDESSRFVNGILGRVARSQEAAEDVPVEESEIAADAPAPQEEQQVEGEEPAEDAPEAVEFVDWAQEEPSAEDGQ